MSVDATQIGGREASVKSTAPAAGDPTGDQKPHLKAPVRQVSAPITSGRGDALEALTAFSANTGGSSVQQGIAHASQADLQRLTMSASPGTESHVAELLQLAGGNNCNNSNIMATFSGQGSEALLAQLNSANASGAPRDGPQGGSHDPAPAAAKGTADGAAASAFVGLAGLGLSGGLTGQDMSNLALGSLSGVPGVGLGGLGAGVTGAGAGGDLASLPGMAGLGGIFATTDMYSATPAASNTRKRGRTSAAATAQAAALSSGLSEEDAAAVPAGGGSAGKGGGGGRGGASKGPRRSSAPVQFMTAVGAMEPGQGEQTQRMVKAQYVGEVKRYKTSASSSAAGLSHGLGGGGSSASGGGGLMDVAGTSGLSGFDASLGLTGALSFGAVGSGTSGTGPSASSSSTAEGMPGLSTDGAGGAEGAGKAGEGSGAVSRVDPRTGKMSSPSGGVLNTPSGDIHWATGVVTQPGSNGTIVTHRLVMRNTASSADANTTTPKETGHRIPVKDHCTAGDDGLPAAEPITYDGSGRTSSGYCSYGELYDKLEAFSRTPTERLLAQGTLVYTRLPCALWTDPMRLVGEFYVVTPSLPPFFLTCEKHGSGTRTVKWKKSGSPQVREVGDGAQVMSQFSVGKAVKSNSKAFSCRVSCVLRNSEYQGVFIVQVRDATRDNAGAASAAAVAAAASSQHALSSMTLGLAGLGDGGGGALGVGGMQGGEGGGLDFSSLLARGGAEGGMNQEMLQNLLQNVAGLPNGGLGSAGGFGAASALGMGMGSNLFATLGLTGEGLAGLGAGITAMAAAPSSTTTAAAPDAASHGTALDPGAAAVVPGPTGAEGGAGTGGTGGGPQDVAELMEAMAQLIANSGYQNVDIKELAAQLGVPVEQVSALVEEAMAKSKPL